jgi:hypothetical protein
MKVVGKLEWSLVALGATAFVIQLALGLAVIAGLIEP